MRVIDTEKPIITLIGHSNITTPIDQTYVDDSATVADNDPSYSFSYDLSQNRMREFIISGRNHQRRMI